MFCVLKEGPNAIIDIYERVLEELVASHPHQCSHFVCVCVHVSFSCTHCVCMHMCDCCIHYVMHLGTGNTVQGTLQLHSLHPEPILQLQRQHHLHGVGHLLRSP